MTQQPETFGHEPVISLTDGRALNRICRRCHTTTTHYDEAYQPSHWTQPIRWPCTTAQILGLAPRTAA